VKPPIGLRTLKPLSCVGGVPRLRGRQDCSEVLFRQAGLRGGNAAQSRPRTFSDMADSLPEGQSATIESAISPPRSVKLENEFSAAVTAGFEFRRQNYGFSGGGTEIWRKMWPLKKR